MGHVAAAAGRVVVADAVVGDEVAVHERLAAAAVVAVAAVVVAVVVVVVGDGWKWFVKEGHFDLANAGLSVAPCARLHPVRMGPFARAPRQARSDLTACVR